MISSFAPFQYGTQFPSILESNNKISRSGTLSFFPKKFAKSFFCSRFNLLFFVGSHGTQVALLEVVTQPFYCKDQTHPRDPME